MKNNMKSTIQMMAALVFVFVFGFAGCEPYEDYVKDYDFSVVYFGTQQPVRTLVARTENDDLEFRIGVTLGGVRENTKGYSAKFALDPDLLYTVEGADQFTLLPDDCYSIENTNNTFVIPKGKFLGDCPVKIDKNKFAGLAGSLEKTYALPLRLLSTDADSLLTGKEYTVIVIKYIDEHSGYYYCKGWQAEWDGTDTVPGTAVGYSYADLSKNKVRLLTTRSLTQFDMAGMGNLGKTDGTADDADHLLINLVDRTVNLEAIPYMNNITDRNSGYSAGAKTFTLDYLYTKGSTTYLVNEKLILRQDVEKGLRFDTWEKPRP